jgi:hypothetical protein
MAFEVPASKKSLKQNRFEFTIGKKTHDIPLLKFAPVEAAEAFEDGRQVAGILAAAGSDAARGAIRQLDGDQLEALVSAWAEASGVDVGELEGSTDS